jgi:hypothetical protein
VCAAAAMIALAEEANQPRHLVLGRFGMDAVAGRLKERLAEIEAGRERSLVTDFPDAG